MDISLLESPLYGSNCHIAGPSWTGVPAPRSSYVHGQGHILGTSQLVSCASMLCRMLTNLSLAVNVTNLGLLGLNQDANFQDLTCKPFFLSIGQTFILISYPAFLSAAGYASSSVLYNLGDPPFLHDVYTVAPFKVSFPLLAVASKRSRPP